MSKVEVTRKAIKNAYGEGYIFQAGYCDLVHLFAHVEPFAYHAGIYGWNCDYYKLTASNSMELVVSTGYRPHGIKIPYELSSKYEKLAQRADANLEELRINFADELLEL